MGIFLDRDVLRSCSISHDIKVFGHVLLHTGHVLRNDCTLISSPEGVYMLSAVSHHSAWWPLVGLLVDPFRASGIQASSLQGSSNLQMFYPLPHQALLLLTGIWSKGAGPWPLNQHLNLFSSLFPVCRWLLQMAWRQKERKWKTRPTQVVFSQSCFFRTWVFGKVKSKLYLFGMYYTLRNGRLPQRLGYSRGQDLVRRVGEKSAGVKTDWLGNVWAGTSCITRHIMIACALYILSVFYLLIRKFVKSSQRKLSKFVQIVHVGRTWNPKADLF